MWYIIATMKQFDQFYRKLNKQQKLAVDTIEGPVMVIAGPGTGKTQILTLRIANILKKTQVNPENILALTYTESGVSSMRHRLLDIIGSPAYAVSIHTFHGFCNEIIKNFPDYFPTIVGGQNINELDQISILSEAIEATALKELKPFGNPLHYIRSIQNSINILKREGIPPAQLRGVIKKDMESLMNAEDLYHEKGAYKGKMKGVYQRMLKNLDRNLELCKIYEFYESHLRSKRVYDYNDMISEVLNKLAASQDLLLTLQEQYQYFLVDEHQDTNNAQNRVLELLASYHENPNVFIVGDDKQAIYRFQGASIQNFMYFKNIYPKAKLIYLEESYRSTQAILDTAESVLPSQKPLKARSKNPEKPIEVFEFSRPESELYFLAESINKKIKNGIKPNQIAVLYRDNRDAEPIASILKKFAIPHCVESVQNVLNDPEIKKLIIVLRAVAEFGSEEKLVQALHADFLGVEPFDLYRMMSEAHKKEKYLYTLLKKENPELYKKMSNWATLGYNISLAELFEIIVRESGFLTSLTKKENVLEKLDSLNAFYNHVKELIETKHDFTIRDLVKYIETIQEHNISIKKQAAFHTNCVRLMTAHAAKGLEFEYVHIVNCYDGHWGNKKIPELIVLPPGAFSLSGNVMTTADPNEDERRLFYVALTRAKKEVAISYASRNLSGRELLPSMFISEIKSELRHSGDAAKYEKEFEKKSEILFAPSREKGVSIKDKEFIRELFMANGLSVTGLNNYLECPWKYFYTNLLRIPKAKSKHQMYGTAIHNALKDFFDSISRAYKLSGKNRKKFLQERFKYHLLREPMLKNDFAATSEKGLKALSGYFDTYFKEWFDPTHHKPNGKKFLSEYEIMGVMIDTGVYLNGKIDRIDISNGLAFVSDYKTMKPKSRNEIEGKTANSNGDLKRQLVFYKILLDNYKKGFIKAKQFSIDFIEPDIRERYKKESFEITNQETDELKEIIKKTADEILNLKFWDKYCDEKDCEYCSLRKSMV